MIESRLQALILAQVPLRFPHVRVWRTAALLARTVAGAVRTLPSGWPDITGIIGHGPCPAYARTAMLAALLPHVDASRLEDAVAAALVCTAGRWLGIECKGDRGRLRPEQVAFGEWIRAAGGVFVVARSLEDVEEALR